MTNEIEANEPVIEASSSLEMSKMPEMTDAMRASSLEKVQPVIDDLLNQTDKTLRKHIQQTREGGAIILTWEHEFWDEGWSNILAKIQYVDGVYTSVFSKQNKKDQLNPDAVAKPVKIDAKASSANALVEDLWPIYSKRLSSKWDQSEFTRKRKGGGGSKKIIQIIFGLMAVGFLAMRIFGE